MRHRKPFRFLITLFAMVLLLVACSPSTAGNQPVQIVATPGGDIELVEVFATLDPLLLSSGTPMPNIFPSSPKKIYLGIKFKKLGTDVSKFKLDYELSYKGIPLDTEFDSQPASWKEQNSGAEVVILPIRLKDSSAFGDGQYQAKLSMDGQLIALLNFNIGGPQPTP